jgi:hypothetical protein
MQSIEGQTQGPIPALEPTQRQPATGYPQNDDCVSQTWSLVSDRSKAIDPGVHRYAETGERDHGTEVLPPLPKVCHGNVAKKMISLSPYRLIDTYLTPTSILQIAAP